MRLRDAGLVHVVALRLHQNAAADGLLNSSPDKPRSVISASECRHGFNFPSAVMRMRLHSAQNA